MTDQVSVGLEQRTPVVDARISSRTVHNYPIEKIVATAIRHGDVWSRLARIVCSPRFIANPFHLKITRFVAEFWQRYRKHPEYQDFQVWLAQLATGLEHDATVEALGRLYSVSETPTPEFLADSLHQELRQRAADLIRSRINAAPSFSMDVIRRELDEVDELLKGETTPERRWPTLGEIITLEQQPTEDTEDLIAVPRLAWFGRHSLLIGLAKLGKSTLVAHGAGAVTRGAPFLDGRAACGLVLWLGMDESYNDAYPRLVEDARARRPRLRVEDPAKPLPFLQSELANVPSEERLVVVIDSLIEYARRTCGEVPGSGDAAAWAAVMRPLTKLAHDNSRVSIVTLHHARRLDGQYRDSGEIVAAVDAIITMLLPSSGQDPNVRFCELVGRRSITRRPSRWAGQLVVSEEEIVDPVTWRTITVERERYEFGGEGLVDENKPADALTPKQRQTLNAIPVEGATWTELKRATGFSQQSLTNHLTKLTAAGLVKAGDDQRYRKVAEHGETEVSQVKSD